jgi:protein-L-isoaspartate(D-aspartate) O-methyltransferase
LVAELRAQGVIRSGPVEAALLAVPRECFIPDVLADQGLEAVYRDEAFVTKRGMHGMPLSSSSQPGLMAQMLELLDARPGHRVLEIGAGTGYNAALLAHITGPAGRITTVDVDPVIAKQARRALRDAGYRAAVTVGDGRDGAPDGAPFDRIIVTACADGVAPSWRDQLSEKGRLALPLRLDADGAAIQLIPVFERVGSRLRSVGLTWGGFMPLHGGDGGWRTPPAALQAGRSDNGAHSSLMSLSGAGLESLSDKAARNLLAATLANRRPALREGLTDLSRGRPPLLLIYLLLEIPARRRVSLHNDDRLGIGIIDRAGRGLAVVSVRSPWRTGSTSGGRRARWRLDAYGDDPPTAHLEHLLSEWRALRIAGRTGLQITAQGHDGTLRLSFTWSR